MLPASKVPRSAQWTWVGAERATENHGVQEIIIKGLQLFVPTLYMLFVKHVLPHNPLRGSEKLNCQPKSHSIQAQGSSLRVYYVPGTLFLFFL